jgi:hypothetical protein
MSSVPELLRAPGAFAEEPFSGEVFRVTPPSTHALTPSVSGGRWAPPASPTFKVPILYTSLETSGALAEVASYLAALTPIPGPRNLRVTRIFVKIARCLRLTEADLQRLGVDMRRYGERNYLRTQEIGVAIAELGFDGLIAPSARWACDNLMIFTANRTDAGSLTIVAADEVEWRAWAIGQAILP